MSENENKNNENMEFEEISDKYTVEEEASEAPKPSFNWAIDPNEKKPVPKGFSIASMVLGILSVVCCCINLYPFFFFIPMVFAVLAIIFKVIAKRKGATDGMATTGLICGLAGLIISVLGIGYTVLILFEIIETIDGNGTTLVL